MFKKFVATAPLACALFFSGQAQAIEFDLTSPTETVNGQAWTYYADAYKYDDSASAIKLEVTGWSYGSQVTPGYHSCSGWGWGGCSYTPGTETVSNVVESASVGNYNVTTGGWYTPPTTVSYGLGVEEANSPDHAVDNRLGDYDMLLLSFSEAVSLESVSANWRGTEAGSYQTILNANNGDVSLLSYQGSAMNPVVSGDSWESLLTQDWTSAGEHQLGASNSTTVNSGGLVSKYWLVGAYNKNLTAGDIGFSEHDDFFKLSGVSVSVNPVPLPGSMLLFGAGLIGLGAIRRRKNK